MNYLIFIGGVLLGIVIGIIIRNCFSKGTIIIDRSDPRKDMYRLDINHLANLHKCKRVLLKIDTKTNLSQK